MQWLKSYFRNPEFSCTGSLIRLGDPDDNYTKKTEFMNATIVIKEKELFIKNDDFDLEQDQIGFIRFPLSQSAELIHYSISDDDVIIDGIKWVNLEASGTHDNFFGFEFESQQKFLEFAQQVSNYVELAEEGYQDPNLRTSNLKSATEKLKISVDSKSSNIARQQLIPELDTSEESKARNDLNFKREAIFSLGHLYSADSIIFMSPGDLYLLGPNLPAPVLADQGVAFLFIRHKEFRVSLDIVRDSQIIMRILIDDHFYCLPDPVTRKVSWVEPVNETERRTWRVDLIEPVDSLETIINIAKFEYGKKMLVSELNEEDQKYIRGEQDSSSEVSERQDPMEIDLDEPPVHAMDLDLDEINDTALGWRSSKVYASRKGKFCIYSNSDQNIQKDSEILLAGKNPTSLLLHKEDTQLLFMTENTPNIVYKLDIEKGVIVDEFTVQDKAFIQLCHQNKMSSLTGTEEFVGLCEKSLYTFDCRTANKIVREFKYSTNPGFTCITTTDEGYSAVASSKGEIRLYKEIGKKSTTNFPALGPGIKSIDSTRNGDWLLATTSSHLMVLRTRLGGDLAYTKAIARKLRPPKKLTLTPEDLNQFNILKIDFSPAKFNVSADGEENSIITSTGKYVIVWNFISVKAGKLYDYTIKSVDERVVKNEFKFGEDNAVLTYPRTFTVQKSRWNLKSL